MELCEEAVMSVLQTQVKNMSETLKMAEECNENMLMLSSWLLVVYYQAEQTKKAIELYLKQKEERNWKMYQAMADAQREALEKQFEESEEKE